jgi:hypothetical protein
MRRTLVVVAVYSPMLATAAYAQTDDNGEPPTGATGVVTDSDGNQTTVDLPDVPDRTPYPADQTTQDFMNGNTSSGDSTSD